MTLKVYRAGQIRIVKPECEAGYFERHPNAIKITTAEPSMRTMNDWEAKGTAKAVDGCKVEPDGHCQHNAPSWLLVLGYI
jgi:hypothetical protein